MKNVFICIVIFIIGCTTIDKDQDLPGVYTQNFEHEFAKNEDTLFIKKASDGKNVYEITRHTGMRKKVDSKLIPKELITEELIAEYNEDSQILTTLNKGKKYVWDRGSRSIRIGDSKYIKSQ